MPLHCNVELCGGGSIRGFNIKNNGPGRVLFYPWDILEWRIEIGEPLGKPVCHLCKLKFRPTDLLE